MTDEKPQIPPDSLLCALKNYEKACEGLDRLREAVRSAESELSAAQYNLRNAQREAECAREFYVAALKESCG